MNFKAAFLLALSVASTASAMTDAQLDGIVQQRLRGDRTGACMAVAVIEGSSVARTYSCADAKSRTRINAQTAFEIGSMLQAAQKLRPAGRDIAQRVIADGYRASFAEMASR